MSTPEADPMSGNPDYAAAVVKVLAEHFPDMADEHIAGVTKAAIKHQMAAPRDSFEFIVDDPWQARWRLKPDREDRRHVHIRCHRVRPTESEAELERTVNEALCALLTAKETDPR